MREDFLNKNFIKYRKSLLYFSQKFNLPLQDTEEMVNDTILAALNSFDHDKGSFESYCRFILKNKIFNFKRDNKELFLLVVFDDLEEIFNSEEFTIEEKEKHNLAVKFLDKLKKTLSGPELEFYNSIYASCDKKVKINISETSKNLGIDPKKGWIFSEEYKPKLSDYTKILFQSVKKMLTDSLKLKLKIYCII